MTLDITTVFTPWASISGGVLIGVASVLLMLFHGRIMGATGIVAGVFFPAGARDWAWRLMVLLGMIAAPSVFRLATGAFPAVQSVVSVPWLVVGGVLVGIGVTVGAGCTSGHGVCGVARLSPRSIIATLVFMTSTAATVYVVRHVIGG